MEDKFHVPNHQAVCEAHICGDMFNPMKYDEFNKNPGFVYGIMAKSSNQTQEMFTSCEVHVHIMMFFF